MAKTAIPVRADIAKYLSRYSRIRALIENEEELYTSEEFCLKLPNEAPNAREVRKKLFQKSFKNIAQDLLSATKDAIFHEGVRLDFDGGEKNPLQVWAEDVTLGGEKTSLLQYCADVVIYGLRGYGHVWTVLDKPDYQANNFQEELEKGAPYIGNIWPGDVINYELKDGELIWFAYKYNYCPVWENPIGPAPKIYGQQTRIWTRDKFIVIDNKGKTQEFNHKFGFVPVVYQSFIESSNNGSILGITPFFTSSNLIIYANNLQSVGDMELFKHGNSILLMEDSSISSMNVEVNEKGDTKTKLQDPGGFNQLVYSGQNKPEYLTKDLEAVGLSNSQAEYYFVAAIQNERTMQSILHKRDTVRETGVTKQFDAEPARAALRATAEDLEQWCTKVLNMVARMLGRDNLQKSFTCEFPENFILTKSTGDKFDEILKMLKSKYPSVTGIREMYKGLTPDIAHDDTLRKKINQEIDEAEITADYEEEVLDEAGKEAEEDAAFEESIKGMPYEEQVKARSEKKKKLLEKEEE